MSRDPLGPGSLLSSGEASLVERARDAFAAAGDLEPATESAPDVEAAARAALAVMAGAGLIEIVAPSSGRASIRSVCALREEIASISGLADAMFVMQGLGSAALAAAGDDDLKRRILPRVASGETIAAIALTEPSAGSDLGAIATRARRDGDDYVLDGVKCYISNAGMAGLYTLFARTGSDGSGRDGITAFAVEAPSPGLSLQETIAVCAPHPLGTIRLEACRVPAANRLGKEGEGYDLALSVLDRFRPTVGAAACGFARRALQESLARARSRRQFGRALADLQAIRFKLADMAVRLEASRLLVWRAATWLDLDGSGTEGAGPDRVNPRRAAAMAKLYATEAAQRIVDEAVQIHGALGVTRGHIVERLYREVRALRIYEGTSEIQRSIIARSILSEGS